MTITSHYTSLGKNISKWITALPSRKTYSPATRQLHQTHTPRRDLLAKYRPPPPTSKTPKLIPTTLSNSALSSKRTNSAENGIFQTTSTVPVGTSFQELPKPGSNLSNPTRLVTPLPAMLPLDSSLVSSSSRMSRDWRETRQPIVVGDVIIPPKPRAPGEEECCMSGCVHCVYTIYAEELEKYSTALSLALEVLTDRKTPKSDWPIEVLDFESENTGRAGDGAKELVQREERKIESGMDSSMSAFLALENRLRKKQAPESSAAS